MSLEQNTWQYLAIEFTKGNSTPVGALLLAVLGRNARNPPWFGNTAEITAEGLVVTSFTGKDCMLRFPHAVGSVNELTTIFSKLADSLKLDDAARVELFRLVRQWVAKDNRADIHLRFTSGG